MKRIILNTINYWLPLAATTVLISGIIYVSVQQTLRRGADEIPVQNIWNVKQDLQNNLTIEQVITQYRKTDMQSSLEPFIIFYAANGKAMAASASISNVIPEISQGVLAYADKEKENRLTWQPKPNVRNAVIVMPYNYKGQKIYILSGRSLLETEVREQALTNMVFSGVIFTLIASYILTFIVQYIKSKKQ